MEWKFFLDSRSAWDAMLAACRGAKKSIDYECYIFHYDEIGKKFISIFEKKAREGVRVRLLFDAAGSYPLFSSNRVENLKHQGIEILFFNPISPWRIGNVFSWFFRDHRKILVVDGHVGFTGGVNVSERMELWRDTQVRCAGESAHQLQKAFDTIWASTRQGVFLGYRQKKSPSPNNPFLFFPNSPRHRLYYKELFLRLRHARHFIYLTTAYFVPNIRLFRLLTRAARRGVDVRILLPEKTDIRIAGFAAASYFGLALKNGIRIFQYQNGRSSILHAKTAVIDDQWASVGSANLDSLSLLFNHEGNLVSLEKEFIKKVKTHFEQDLKNAREVQYVKWLRRPWHEKFLEYISWPLHGIL